MKKATEPTTVEEPAKIDNGAAAKLRILEAKFDRLVKFLETTFGFDINKDGKIGLILLLLIPMLAVTGLALSPSTNTIWNLTDSTGTNDLIQVDRSGNLIISGAITGSGAQTVPSAAIASATLGTATIQTNLTVSGRITAVTINQATVSTNLTVSGSATLTGGIVGGASITNTFYTVVAGTADCITNTVVTRSGIVTSGTTQ